MPFVELEEQPQVKNNLVPLDEPKESIRSYEPTFYESKIKPMLENIGILETPMERIAKAQNVYAEAKSKAAIITKDNPEAMGEVMKGLIPQIDEKWDDYVENEYGLYTTNRANEKMLNFMITAGLAPVAIAHPIKALVGIATYAGTKAVAGATLYPAIQYTTRVIQNRPYYPKYISDVRELLPEDASQATKDTVGILELIGLGGIASGVARKAPAILEGMTKDLITKYNMPKEIYISAEKIKSIYQTGEKISPEELDLWKTLNLSGKQTRDALSKGISVKVPAEKVVTLVDKPYWAKIKEVFNIQPFEVTKKAMVGTPKSAVGELPAPEVKPSTITPIENVVGLKGETGQGAGIMGELQDLAEIARGAKNPEEFALSFLKPGDPTFKITPEEMLADIEATAKEQASEKYPEERIKRESINTYFNMAVQGRTGGAFAEQVNATFKPLKTLESDDIRRAIGKDELPKSGKIKVYRGFSGKGSDELRTGDFVTNLKSEARKYTRGTGEVKEYVVDVKDLSADNTGRNPREMAYTPDGELPKISKRKLDYIDFYNQSKLSTKEGGMAEEVTGTGETKTRTLAKGVEEKAIENKLTKGLGDLPEYQTVNMKEQAAKAQDLLTKDYEKSKRIAMGEELPPADIIPESVFVAVENKAINEADVATLKDLATASGLTAEATTMGQRIRTLAERNPESPVTAIKEVSEARTQMAQKRLKTKETKILQKAEMASIKEHIKKVAPTKETWTDFIKGLQC